MKQETTTEPQRRRATRVFSAKEKSQTVLALWSGRRSPSALAKTLGVPWATINTWEKRALSGMLTALDPKWKQPAAGPQSLPPRVEKLMTQTLRPATATEAVAVN